MGHCLAAYLMPHPPILVGDLGGPEADAGRQTSQAMAQASQRIAQAQPPVLVVLSPHGCDRPNRLAVRQGDVVQGDMGRFGRPDIALRFAHAGNLAQAYLQAGQDQGLALDPISPETPLDHGAFVPLYFMKEAGFQGQVLHLVTGWPGLADEAALGALLKDLLNAQAEDWALIISGDLSHTLSPTGPYGYQEAGMDFEKKIDAILRSGDLGALDAIRPREIEAASQCGLAPLRFGRALLGSRVEAQVLSHEWPYGVGYMVAAFEKGELSGV